MIRLVFIMHFFLIFYCIALIPHYCIFGLNLHNYMQRNMLLYKKQSQFANTVDLKPKNKNK
jgi:hypothetical protein